MSRIAEIIDSAKSANRKLLIPYLVMGDPDLDTSLALMHQLVADGADILELGIPFSDPSSDGPVIQRGVERALAGGTSLSLVLDVVAQFRKQDPITPLVLMGYLNPVEIMGYEVFVDRAKECGIDGVLLVDMPPAESGELHTLLRAAQIDTIYLIAPTTGEERARQIISHTSGYLYYVSLKGVTGAAVTDYESVNTNLARLRQETDLPIVVGFGIKDGASAVAMGEHADGVIIGSALVSEIAKLSDIEDRENFHLQATTAMISEVRSALDKSTH